MNAEQPLGWLLPYTLLMILMLFSMVTFTATLLVRYPPPGRKAASHEEVLRRLLALNTDEHAYRLLEGKDCDLTLHWDVVDASWRERYAKVKLSTIYRARLLLDETRHEVRINEYMRSSSFFVGFDGWIPHISGSIWLVSGYVNAVWSGQAYGILPGFPPRIGQVYNYAINTAATKHDISRVVNRAGWIFRPVILWFEATRGGLRLEQTLLPAPLRRWPARRVWGIIYPLSYFLGMAVVVVGAWPLSLHNLLVILLVSAGWWGVWGLLTWVLLGFPPFWRRRKH